MPPGLTETLEQLAPDLETLTEDWWLIGSAALVLSGVEPGGDRRRRHPDDACRRGAFWPGGGGSEGHAPGPSERFRSEVFFRRSDTPLPVDVMAGFEVSTADGWTPVRPRTRVALNWRGGRYFAPSQRELLDILALFGRPQDRERAALLNAVWRGRN